MLYPRIFIGGTGRSGTTILYRALGCHENIYALPKEMRFINEPDGLMDLVDALTIRYSINKAREALYKFERLMRVYMAQPEGPHYPNYNLPEWIGPEYYHRRLDQFCNELVDFSFHGISAPLQPPLFDDEEASDWKEQLRNLTRFRRGKDDEIRQYKFPQREVRVVKYFAKRQKMLALAAELVDDLFMHIAEKEGKQTWCEKTPNTLQSLDFIWELFPDSVFIHMLRDPRGVMESMRKVRWAPDDTEDLCRFLIHIYDRWFDIKASMDVSKHRYLEVKLEHLAAYPDATLQQIATFCELPHRYDDLPAISQDKVNYWQARMGREDLQIVNKLLGPYIVQLGYTI